jgi:hypothetical protein
MGRIAADGWHPHYILNRGPGVGVPNQKRFEWPVKVPTACGVICPSKSEAGRIFEKETYTGKEWFESSLWICMAKLSYNTFKKGTSIPSSSRAARG